MGKRTDIHKVMIIGSGPIIIGQACEFDYSGTQACKALRSLGYQIVLVNSNPATIMTDPGIADVTYIEPLKRKCPRARSLLRNVREKSRPKMLRAHFHFLKLPYSNMPSPTKMTAKTAAAISFSTKKMNSGIHSELK